MNILIAEDEQDIRELLELHLIKDGYTVFQAEDGLETLKIFENEHIDLVLLDVMMPEIDGFKVLKRIRETSQVPVMFLTARETDTDKILGLGLGADDYIVKPFSPIEVIARIQAQLRRCYSYTGMNVKSVLKVGELQLDIESYTLYKGEEIIEVNAKEYKIIELLMENKGKVFTKKQLYEAVWEDAYYGDDNTIMVHISHLRDKIEDNPKEPKYLKTVRGIGYKMEKLQL